MLDYLLTVASAIEREEDVSPAEGREISLLGLALIPLCTTVGILVRNVHITEATNRAIFTAMKATYQIFQKLPLGENVYHNILDHVLQGALDPIVTDISSKISTKSTLHGVLHNLAIKLAGNVFDLLDLLEKALDEDSNFVDSELNPLLESLNCTLGSLNRALDPLPGGKHAMEAELYNVHLTPHKFRVVPTRTSEPTVSYCCATYRQLAPR